MIHATIQEQLMLAFSHHHPGLQRGCRLPCGFLLAGLLLAMTGSSGQAGDVETLANEVRSRGWICFGARTPAGDWDLFVMRPDGTGRRNLTNTPDANEGLPRFSPDGKRLIYRRIPRGERFDNNRHGAQGQLMIARRDGSDPKSLGEEGAYAWASWMPDSQRLAFLEPKGIRILDLATGQSTTPVKRHGIYQQMIVSPNGQEVCGVSNSFGASWMVARVELTKNRANAVSRLDCCTPDWFPDSQRLVFSGRPGTWTQLWQARVDGTGTQLLYAEDGRHVYGGSASPDGAYILFTGNQNEDGDAQADGAPMNLMRVADAPMIGGDSAELARKYPQARRGPLLTLPPGWEPHWTAPIANDPLASPPTANP
jgi:Tol biopolymer transport system component